MRPHRVVVLDVLTKHPPPMPFVDGDDEIEALAPERADHPLGDGVGVRRAQRSENRLDPIRRARAMKSPPSLRSRSRIRNPGCSPRAVASIICCQIQGAFGCSVTFQCRMRRRSVVDHDEHVERAEGERLDREQIGGPDAGRVVAEKRAPRLARGAPQRLPAVATHGAGADLEAKGTQLAGRCGRRPTADAQWRCGRSAVAALRESGVVRSGDDSSSASRRAKQNDATAQPCPARPSRACLASRTNHVPAVTRVGGRGDEPRSTTAPCDDGPLCRRRADAAAPSSRGRDLGGRGPMRRVLRQADGGRAQTSLSWLARYSAISGQTCTDQVSPSHGCQGGYEWTKGSLPRSDKSSESNASTARCSSSAASATSPVSQRPFRGSS